MNSGFGSFGFSPIQQTTRGSSLFPQQSASTNPFGSLQGQVAVQPQQGLVPSPSSEHWLNQLVQIQEQYDPRNSKCRFIGVIYDEKRKKSGGSVVWPESMLDELENAKKANPDPQRYYPSPVLGLDGLKNRVEQQKNAEKLIFDSILNLENRMCQVQSKLENLSRTLMPSQLTTLEDLSHRLLKVMKTVDMVRGTEVYLNDGEHAIQREMNQLAKRRRMISDVLQRVKEMVRDASMSAEKDYEVVEDVRQLKKMMEFLEEMRVNSSKAKALADKDLEDLNTAMLEINKITEKVYRKNLLMG